MSLSMKQSGVRFSGNSLATTLGVDSSLSLVAWDDMQQKRRTQVLRNFLNFSDRSSVLAKESIYRS